MKFPVVFIVISVALLLNHARSARVPEDIRKVAFCPVVSATDRVVQRLETTQRFWSLLPLTDKTTSVKNLKVNPQEEESEESEEDESEEDSDEYDLGDFRLADPVPVAVLTPQRRNRFGRFQNTLFQNPFDTAPFHQISLSSFEQKYDNLKVTRRRGQKRSKRMTGGKIAAIYDWPWVVRVEFLQNGRYLDEKLRAGVGTLLAPNLILTSAHMLKKIHSVAPIILTNPTIGIKVAAGSQERWRPVEPGAQSRRVVRVFFHPDPVSDLAILKLAAGFNCIRDRTSLSPLNLHNEFKAPKNCETASWGLDGEGNCPAALQEGFVSMFKKVETSTHLLVKGVDDKTVIQNVDAGAPLMCREKRTNRWLQYGIMSYAGDHKDEGPIGVFSNVAQPNNLAWIDTMFRENAIVAQVAMFQRRCPNIFL